MSMLIPCTAFVGLACCVTLLSLAVKSNLVYQKLKIRAYDNTNPRFAKVVPSESQVVVPIPVPALSEQLAPKSSPSASSAGARAGAASGLRVAIRRR